jgi:hypothetical protein
MWKSKKTQDNNDCLSEVISAVTLLHCHGVVGADRKVGIRWHLEFIKPKTLKSESFFFGAFLGIFFTLKCALF